LTIVDGGRLLPAFARDALQQLEVLARPGEHLIELAGRFRHELGAARDLGNPTARSGL